LILDTNALSAMAEGAAELDSVLRKASRVAVPVVVLGEFRYGISGSRNRKHYERWLDDYISRFAILDLDEHTALAYATVRVDLKKAGTPIPANDVWIASLCRQHSLPILSRDRHFDVVPGIKRIDW
jgi:tRNA(fMet)-specific endonuclease VapC